MALDTPLPFRMMRATFAAGLLVSLAVGSARPADKGSADAPRNYADGPLTAADFRGKPPDPPPTQIGVMLVALSTPQIRYTMRYKWDEKEKGVVTAMLTEMHVVAVYDCQNSWNTNPSDTALLSHEQGHFDICELNARRAQKQFDQLLAGPGMTGHGTDEASARADLTRTIDTHMQMYYDLNHDEQVEYDRLTRHGTIATAQLEQRRLQQQRLRDSAKSGKQ